MGQATAAVAERTFRSVPAEQTRRRVEPMLPTFGITRVADITRLDEIGLPCHVAYRPCGKTLAVSLGIGLTHAQSWVGAAMESIETWHAENVTLQPAARGSARDVRPGYDVRLLNRPEHSPLTDRVTLDWLPATGLLTGEPALVPLEFVRLDATSRFTWDHLLFQVTSNGLGVGNSPAEATLHGLIELIERDCCAPYTITPLSRRRYADPAGTGNPTVEAALAALRAADCWVELCETTNEMGIPAYACSIWSPDVPLVFGGFGCHPDAGQAVARALMEAIQSRLACISGARDDIDAALYDKADGAIAPSIAGRTLHPVVPSGAPDGADALLRFCAERVRARTGVEPMVVDLTQPGIGIAASKVVAPGLALCNERDMARRPGENNV
jgi:ribosomal protein S12 methylthiotransferase accessory factor